MSLQKKELDKLKFPIGLFIPPNSIEESDMENWIEILKIFPTEIKKVVENLTADQKKYKYRPDGWNIAQVVHHCADSHMHSLIRFKWALTEKEPMIKAYFEDRWALLHDYSNLDLTDSLQLIEVVHKKLVLLLNGLSREELKRTFIHPETKKTVVLEENIGIYAWHCKHHLAHIEQAISTKGKFN